MYILLLKVSLQFLNDKPRKRITIMTFSMRFLSSASDVRLLKLDAIQTRRIKIKKVAIKLL